MVEVFGQDDRAGELGPGLVDPLLFGPRLHGRHHVGQDQRAHPGPLGGAGGVGHRRVVVEDVEQPGHGQRLDLVAADDGMDQDVGAGAQPVEPVARHGVAGDDHRAAAVVDPVADGRVDRRMVGGRRRHPHGAALEHDALGDVGGHRGRPPGEVVVVGQPVADVGLQHRLGGGHEGRRARRAEDVEGIRGEGHGPPRGDDVVEIGDVVAVEMGEEHRLEGGGPGQRGGGPHGHAAAGSRTGGRPPRCGPGWTVRPGPGPGWGSRSPGSLPACRSLPAGSGLVLAESMTERD